MTRNCQTPMHVWETKCTSCYGSGEASAHLSSCSAVPINDGDATQASCMTQMSQAAKYCQLLCLGGCHTGVARM